MPVTAIARPRTRRWEAILLAFSLILGLTVAATTPASAVGVTANNDSFTTPMNTTLITYPSNWVAIPLGGTIPSGRYIVGATTDTAGNIYAAASDGKMYVFTSDGTYTITWTLAQFNHLVTDLEYDGSGHIYVASASEASVYRYMTDGTLDISWANGTGMITGLSTSTPQQIAVDSVGNLYILDHKNNHVFKYNSSGIYVETLSTGLEYPNAIGVDIDGKVYVGSYETSPHNSGVINIYTSSEFDANSSPSLIIGPPMGGGKADLVLPRSIAIDKTNSVYVTELSPTRLLKFLPGTTTPDSSSATPAYPMQLWSDANGNMYAVGGPDATTIYRFGINVLSNDVGTGLTTIAANSATSAGGTVAVRTDGTFTYTPLTGFVGTDTFTYTATDSSVSDSATVSITVTPAPGSPDAPTIGIVNSVTATTAVVNWSAPSNNGGATIESYAVTPSPACSACSGLTVTGNPPTSSASVTGLSPGTTYTFTVSATNSRGPGWSSSPSLAITTVSVAPDVPTNLASTAGNAQVVLTWLAPSSNGGAEITDYKIEYQSSSGPWVPFPHAAVATSPATVDGLTNGTAYTFRVSAINSVDTGNPSGTTAATPVAPSAPPPPPPPPTPAVAVSDAPTGVSGTAGSSQVTVSWLVPASDGGAVVTGYTVTASPGGATCTTLLRGCTVSHLTNGTAYTFTVHATNSVGDSAESSSSAGVTPASPAPGLAGCTSGLTRFTDIGDSFAAADIACVNRLSIVHGRTDTTYDPASLVTREQATAMLARTWRSMGRACPAVQSQFTDIGGSFARADIECMWGLGIVHGVTDTIFDPGASVTRQEMAALLARTWRALGHDLRPGSVVFTDIGGSFARTDIESLRVLGITRGNTSSTKFDPGGVVTREQMAAFLARAIRAFAV